MLSSLAVADYIRPPPVITIDYDPEVDRSRADELRRLADNAARVAEFRAAVNEQSENFEKLYHAIEQSQEPPAELEKAAEFLLERERQAATALVPQIRQLEQTLTIKYRPTHFILSLRRSAEEALDAAQTWLEVFQNLRIRLLKLASDRRAAAGETGGRILSDAGEMKKYLRRIVGE
jgi:septal ring factor EnvC (AmiA/AmiB activator)